MKKLILSAATKTGKHLLKNYGKIKDIHTKAGNSYFTNVDLECERIIVSEIQKKHPKHSILSEEKATKKRNSDYEWIIDPLDGTHNYIQEFPLFGTSIALAYKGEVTHSAINLPVLGEMYYAEKGKGAFLNGKKISVSDKKEARKAFVVTDLTLRYNAERKLNVLKKLRNNVYDMRALGCAVVAHSLVAKGSADALFTTQMFPWDIAGGGLLIEEAGGKVTNFFGNQWKPKKGAFIATNGNIHEKILKILNNRSF